MLSLLDFLATRKHLVVLFGQTKQRLMAKRRGRVAKFSLNEVLHHV